MGRLPFLGARLLGQLRAEAVQQRPSEDATHGPAGDALSRLAVSRQLWEAVSQALGVPVVPAYEAVYQYHRPGTSVPPHRDKEGYDLVLHLTLEHGGVVPGSDGSVLEVYSDEGHVERTQLLPGQCLLLRGRDAVHTWTPMGSDEHRTLIAVALRSGAVDG